MRVFLRLCTPIALAVLPACLPAPFGVAQAHAAMRFCNNTQSPIEAAIAYRGQNDSGADSWISEGWWQIEPGQCSRVYSDPLTQRFYFYYATSLPSTDGSRAPNIWSNDKYKFCTDTKAFRVVGDANCAGRGYKTEGFQQIDVGPDVRDYTLDFKERK